MPSGHSSPTRPARVESCHDFQTIDEPAVVDSVTTYRRIDTDDPQASQRALALLPVAICVAQCALDSFYSTSIETTVCSTIALSELENSVMATTRLKTSFYPWHLLSPPWSHAPGPEDPGVLRAPNSMFGLGGQPFGSNRFTSPASPEARKAPARSCRLRLLDFFVRMCRRFARLYDLTALCDRSAFAPARLHLGHFFSTPASLQRPN